MIALLLLVDAPDAQSALVAALSQIEPVSPDDFVLDDVPFVEDGVRFYRWLAVGERRFGYPDAITETDGAQSAITRHATNGYVSPDGEGRWAVFELQANAHMMEEAVGSVLFFIDPDWGRYEE